MGTGISRWRLSVVVLSLLTAMPVAAAGLYDNGKDLKTGDIADQDYWWAKYDEMMLDYAIKSKQPEGRIGVNIAVAKRRFDDLLKKYPNHEDLKKMKEKFDEVEKKIDPNAQRGAAFMPNCPWDEANFAQLWVNFHTSKMLLDDKQYTQAYSLLQNVKQNYDIMLKPDRMKEYPEDLRKWVEDNKGEADKMYDLAKEKSHG